MRIDVISVFGSAVDEFCSVSLLGRARQSGRVDLRLHDPRDHTSDVHLGSSVLEWHLVSSTIFTFYQKIRRKTFVFFTGLGEDR